MINRRLVYVKHSAIWITRAILPRWNWFSTYLVIPVYEVGEAVYPCVTQVFFNPTIIPSSKLFPCHCGMHWVFCRFTRDPSSLTNLDRATLQFLTPPTKINITVKTFANLFRFVSEPKMGRVLPEEHGSLQFHHRGLRRSGIHPFSLRISNYNHPNKICLDCFNSNMASTWQSIALWAIDFRFRLVKTSPS